MSGEWSELRRVVRSSGVYAAGAIAQSGVSFFLLPVYTRFLEPTEYGVLELLNAFSAILFAVLMLGLPSAIIKCYHRDCDSPREQGTVLATAGWLELPVLLAVSTLVFVFAGPLGTWLVGTEQTVVLIRLVAANGVFSSLLAIVLASFRAGERAMAYSVFTLAQFAVAMALNVALVVGFGLGIRGVLWGNLISNALVLPIAVAAVRCASFRVNPRLVGPLLRFGLLLIPVMLAGWVMDLSDRYVLRLYRDLEEVAVYGVGYKIAMVLQIGVVWPFQLAWPAVSFAISRRAGHQVTYARTLTYLSLLLAAAVLGLALLAPVALPAIVGAGYRESAKVVPAVALAYALNGIHYCVSPGLHLSGKTRYLPLLSGAAAALNLGLNFLLIPRFGMLGAVWATVIAFLGLAAATWTLSQRNYPVDYEVGRLLKIVAAAGAVYFLATAFEPRGLAWSLVWHLAMAGVAFPALLVAFNFLDRDERSAVRRAVGRLAPFLVP